MAYNLIEPQLIFLQYAMTESGEALRALQAVRRLAGVREQRHPGVEILEWRSIIRELRAALTATANLSRVLWSARNAVSRARASELRGLCNLPDEHALDNRDLRNHIEHTDERLDLWLADGPRPFLTVEYVAHVEPDIPDEKRAEAKAACVLVYDVASDTVTYLGDTFSLSDLEAQVTEVQASLSRGIHEIIKTWPVVE